jgi:hypothetical protein
MPLMTQKAYAKERGITAQYVSKLVGQGKIVLRNGLVDPVQADEARSPQRPSTSRPRHKGSNAHGGGRPPRQQRANGNADAGDAPVRSSETASLTKARAMDAGFQASLRRLEYMERTKQLLPAAEVLEAERRKNANIRLRFRGLARVLAPLMARTGSAAECERLLLEEIDHHLEELARDPLASGIQAASPATPAPAEAAVQTAAGGAA